MKTELAFRSLRFGFGVSRNADEDSFQLAGFFFDSRQSLFWNESRLSEQFQPVFALLQFLQRALNFANKVGVGFGT